jgi:aquaporin Z
MRKYIVEFIGTFLLVFFGCSAALLNAGPMGQLMVGLGLAGIIYAGGHISGAHFNPAVTLSVWLRGKCPSGDVIPYLISQLTGAVLAALTAVYFRGVSQSMRSDEVAKVFLAEVLGSFVLAWVILNVATAKANEGNSFYGLAIGGTVAALSFALGDVSGAAFNPAMALGGWVIGGINGSALWIYMVASFLGGAIAAQVFKLVKAQGD